MIVPQLQISLNPNMLIFQNLRPRVFLIPPKVNQSCNCQLLSWLYCVIAIYSLSLDQLMFRLWCQLKLLLYIYLYMKFIYKFSNIHPEQIGTIFKSIGCFSKFGGVVEGLWSPNPDLPDSGISDFWSNLGFS